MMRTKPTGQALLLVFLLNLVSGRADWPTLHGNAARSGFTAEPLNPPIHLSWARAFKDERLGTAMEPIVAAGMVFLATHRGNLYALRADTGEALWRFQAHGAFLQSPAVAGHVVIAGNTDGRIYAVGSESGRLAWAAEVGRGGVASSPTVLDDRVLIGTRGGDFVALNTANGQILWRQSLGAPVRQTAAAEHDRVYVTSEDLRVHALEVGTGRMLWSVGPLSGQSARDYYPMVVEAGGKTLLLIRTNPMLGMGHHIGRDRTFLCQNAGVDDSSWQKIDAWIKSPEAEGNPELWRREQQAVIEYLKENPLARTCYVLDAATGREAMIPPVLWVGGCQSVGTMPALTADGRLLVLYRSAYGHWNHGVAPLVALGLLDLTGNQIAPLAHQYGRQPAWNTFWGTADESQNFTVAGPTALIVHQGTLSGFNLQTRQLFPLAGNRDTFGGLPNPPWARNEWHGPGRGGVALAGARVYWLTGSRLMCLQTRADESKAPVSVLSAKEVPMETNPRAPGLDAPQIQTILEAEVEALLAERWAPLWVEPGLSGRDFSFADSGELFSALAWSYPHLGEALQEQVRTFLAQEWKRHPPYSMESHYDLGQGKPREYCRVPGAWRTRIGQDTAPHPFGNTYAIWLYARRCHDWRRVLEAWPDIRAAFGEFIQSGWRLDGAQGDLYANRYLASCLALEGIAQRAGDTHSAEQAALLAQESTDALVAWWERVAKQGTLTHFQNVAQLDPFIGRGDGLSFRVAPHRHKVALLRDLTPEVATLLRTKAPEAVDKVLSLFDILYQTWWLVGEERQIHFGENFIDPPDLALGGFQALAWLRQAPPAERAAQVDLPFCRADLYYMTKLAVCLE